MNNKNRTMLQFEIVYYNLIQQQQTMQSRANRNSEAKRITATTFATVLFSSELKNKFGSYRKSS